MSGGAANPLTTAPPLSSHRLAPFFLSKYRAHVSLVDAPKPFQLKVPGQHFFPSLTERTPSITFFSVRNVSHSEAVLIVTVHSTFSAGNPSTGSTFAYFQQANVKQCPGCRLTPFLILSSVWSHG
jgi:hypothetical protein